MATPSLADFQYYNSRNYGGVTADEINSPRAQTFLAELRKYDPNATFTPVQLGGEGGSGAVTYQLQYDPSKLPGTGVASFDNNGALGGANPIDPNGGYAGGSGFLPQWGTVNDPSKLIDPTAIYQGTPYGTISPNSNFRPEKPTWLDYFGPAAVGAFGLLMGGIPALYQGVFGQGSFGGADLSGLGASDPFVQGGTGAMDMTGSAGTGIPGSFGANAPLGSAESSLFGTGVQTAPETAFGGAPFDTGIQDAAPIIDRSIPASVSDSIRNGVMPSLGSIGQSLGNLGGLLGKIPGLGGSGSGGGSGGGNGLLAMAPRAQQTYTDLTNILRHFYGGGNG